MFHQSERSELTDNLLANLQLYTLQSLIDDEVKFYLHNRIMHTKHVRVCACVYVYIYIYIYLKIYIKNMYAIFRAFQRDSFRVGGCNRKTIVEITRCDVNKKKKGKKKTQILTALYI